MYTLLQKKNGPVLRYPQLINAPRNVHCVHYVCDEPQKYLYGSQSSDNVLPYSERISQIITTSLGGRIHYGNFYLGQPLITNYLGRFEGQPGGGGVPIRNKF
jgi:hypothetical protein